MIKLMKSRRTSLVVSFGITTLAMIACLVILIFSEDKFAQGVSFAGFLVFYLAHSMYDIALTLTDDKNQ